jgi:hypothetical protein
MSLNITQTTAFYSAFDINTRHKGTEYSLICYIKHTKTFNIKVVEIIEVSQLTILYVPQHEVL